MVSRFYKDRNNLENTFEVYIIVKKKKKTTTLCTKKFMILQFQINEKKKLTELDVML